MSQLPRMNLSHAGFLVTDFERMFDFYTRVLGFQVSDRATRDNGDQVVFLTNDPNDHHIVVLASGRPADGASTVNQLSFRVRSLDDVRQAWRALKDEPSLSNVATVCHGNAWSFYFHDPEDNRIEIYTDTPWQVTQPCRMEIDLTKSDVALMSEVEAKVRDLPGFMPFEDWRIETARKMGLSDFRIQP